MMLEPCGHRVLIKPDDIEKKTEFGLVLVVDEKQEKAAQVIGTVVAIGKNAWKAFDDGHAWAKVGDKVAYTRYAGKPVKDPETDEDFLVVNDEDITCRITEGKE